MIVVSSLKCLKDCSVENLVKCEEVCRSGLIRQWLSRPLNGACFDQNRMYRYQLWRTWDSSGPRVLFVMLNPSSADESDNDPTIRRCIAFAKSWGFGGIEVCNIFAYRSRSPVALLTASDPVGNFNDYHIDVACKISTKVVVAWGAHAVLRKQDNRKFFEKREKEVNRIISLYGEAYCLKETLDRYPSHPLYLRGSLKPKTFHWSYGR